MLQPGQRKRTMKLIQSFLSDLEIGKIMEELEGKEEEPNGTEQLKTVLDELNIDMDVDRAPEVLGHDGFSVCVSCNLWKEVGTDSLCTPCYFSH